MKSFLFIIACMFLSSSMAYSEASTSTVPSAIMTIESIDISNETVIHLDNGTSWTYKGTDMFVSPNNWELGDRVNIVYVYLDGYFLENGSYQGCIPVKFNHPLSENLAVNTIQEILFDAKKNTNKIILDDHTEWFIGSWSSCWMEKWQVGDRIIVTSQEFMVGYADHLLINLDRGKKIPENVRAQLLYTPKTVQYDDQNKRQGSEWSVSIAKAWEENDALLIELNNGTLLRTEQPHDNWEIGDPLELTCAYGTVEVLNIRKDDEVSGKVVGWGADLPSVQTVSDKGKKMTLSDHSVWFSSCKEFKKWKKGERILISSKSSVSWDTTTHTLINMDRIMNNKHQADADSTLMK